MKLISLFIESKKIFCKRWVNSILNFGIVFLSDELCNIHSLVQCRSVVFISSPRLEDGSSIQLVTDGTRLASHQTAVHARPLEDQHGPS